ncbi:MAG: hypothetical protein QOE34_2439 [Verrucomicrobiota bacterium]|jgi:hypothetical protein
MQFMKKHIAKLAYLSVFAALSVYAESTPSPTPSPTPHTEPSASPTPTPTPHTEPSATPTPTPHQEPSATPRPSPSPTPTPEPGDDHHGEVSLRGFYGSTTPTGSLIVFYIEKNTHVQIHVLDVTGQAIGFAEGALTNGSFALTLTTGQAIIGTANDSGIAFTLGGQPFQASRFATLGTGSAIAGGYFGVAHGPTGESQVMFIIDASNHIIMIQRTGTVLSGGFGTLTPPVSPATQYSFVLNSTIGSSSAITGNFTITDGVFSGTFTTSAGTFTVNTFKSSLVNRMANISTRGLVGTGQGQLIGGFIITGGPKLVLIRAMGPSLAAFGVSPALANPSVQLFAGSTPLASNDDWKTNANAAQIIATGIPPTDDLESALLVRLEPGAYTTVVTGAGTATGIALVEVYEIGSE